ncbi:hypothetical protein YO5_18077 [Stutzerimonas stutzeri TS44]|nr:hypothetical protein YO5_18077 [Stutzerimonas stutzeri TS44]
MSLLDGVNDNLIEQDIERRVRDGAREAMTRSRALLDQLGISPADLQEWANEMVELGTWPEGDFVEAFRAWKLKRTSNADPDPTRGHHA